MPNRINVNQWEEMIRAVPRGPGQLFGLAPEQIIVDDILPKYKFTVKKSPNGPEIWDKLLEAVDEIFEPKMSCIAGGAVRDYCQGVAHRDIDLWLCPSKVPESVDELEALGQCLGWREFRLKSAPKGYEGKKEIECVFQGYVFDSNIDIIFTTLDSPRQVVEEFDYYINQHWYHKGEVNYTPEAKTDAQKKVWRLL